jgi:hypothetical protein
VHGCIEVPVGVAWSGAKRAELRSAKVLGGGKKLKCVLTAPQGSTMTRGRPPPGPKLFVNGTQKASGYGYDRGGLAAGSVDVLLTLMRRGGML